MLADVAARDLSAGRLAEGHADALAILDEAGRSPVAGAAYGVWAARRPHGGPVARPTDAGWSIEGYQEFCSGCSVIDRALLAVDGPDGRLLLEVDVAEVVVAHHPGTWPAIGMAGSDSGSLTIGGTVSDAALVGEPDFYTSRRGFWWGASGVAACWWGGARGLLGGLLVSIAEKPGPHRAAAIGRAVAAVDTIQAVLQIEAERIDAEGAHPGDGVGPRRRALSARQAVHDQCQQVLVHVVEAGGARLMCHDWAESQRAADLVAYLSQYHGGSDVAELAYMVLEARQ